MFLTRHKDKKDTASPFSFPFLFSLCGGGLRHRETINNEQNAFRQAGGRDEWEQMNAQKTTQAGEFENHSQEGLRE